MNNISIKKAVNSILCICIILFTAVQNSKGQNQNSITLSAPNGVELNQACQYIKLVPGATGVAGSGYYYAATNGSYMEGNIDNTNMCGVTYISGGGFSGNNPPPLNTNLPVGTINGTFNVDANGAANYNIALVIPPGTMGMEPNLSLNYNSSGGNGLLGTGWSLGGLSAITRATQNYYNDGQTAPVTLTNSDRFLLDGNRLTLVPPATTVDYGLDGTIYHTENETFQQVISHGQANGGPLWFEVDTKDGKTLQFGNTTDSRIMACGSNQVLTWLLNSVTDNRGNYMNITYVQDGTNCQYYPESIEYTGTTNFSPYNKVTFSYALRGDPSTDYTAGYPENQNVLMTGIQMYAQNTLVHHYQLDYSIDQLYSHLSEITEYGSDGSSYNSTKINYHNNLSNSSSVVTSTSIPGLATDPYYSLYTGDYPQADGILPRFLLCGDFGGTGQTGVVEEENVATYPTPFNGVDWYLYQNINSPPYIADGANVDPLCGYLNGGGVTYDDDNGDIETFDPSYGFPSSVPPLDMNGDGKDDLVFFSEINETDVFQVYLSTGDGFSSTPIQFYGNGNLYIEPYIPVEGDFDGDGVPDLVIFYPITGNVAMFSLKNGVPVSHYFGIEQIFNSADQGADFAMEQAQRSAYAIDINGDGRKELLVTGNNDVYIYNLNADGTISPQPATGTGKTYPNFGIDIGWVGTTNNISPSTATVYPGDFNGDGKTDLLIYNNIGGYNLLTGQGGPSNNWYISYSNGTDFGPFQPATFMADNGPAYGYMFAPTFGIHQYYVGDFNGDGKDDIIDQGWGYSNSSPQVSINGSLYNTFNAMTLNMYFGNGNATDGAGAFVQKTYTVSLTNSLGPNNQTVTGDFNGDGHEDLLVYNENQPNGTSQLYSFDLNNQPDNGINKAIAISNGLNATTNITYNNLPAMAANAPYAYEEGNSATFPVQDIQWPMYVTQSVLQDNGNGTQNEIEYSYAGALNHIQGKGFLGFSLQQIYDVATNHVTTNKYEFTNGYYDQLPLSTLSFSYSTGTSIDLKGYQYITLIDPTSIPVSGPVNGYLYDIHYNYLNQEVNNNELYGITNTNTYQEDTYGNNTFSQNTNAAITSTATSTYVTEPSIGWNGQLPACMATNTATTTRTSQPAYTRTSSYLYNNYGELTTKTDDIGLVTTYAYDVLGNLTSVTVGGGVPSRTSSYTYDYPYKRFVITETNPLNQSVQATYDNAYGNTLTSTDLNGLATKYGYDGFGRMQQMVLPTTEQVTASRLWDNVSGLANSLFYVQVSAPGEATMANYYDKLGKTLRSQKNGFDGTNINKDITYFNDQQMASESEPYNSGTPTLNTFTYDNFQRQSILTNAAQLTATYSYTYGQPTYSLVTTGSNAPTKTFSQTYDASGVLTQATDDGGTLSYTYASCGKPISITVPGSQNETLSYDSYGRLHTQTDPDLGATTYSYDDLSEILNVTDPTSNYTQTYDLLGRVLTSNESTSNESNTYTYDNMPHGIGMLGSVTGSTPPNALQGANAPFNTISYSYSYDSYSRPQSKTETILGTAYTTSYVYDNLNRVTQITYPNSPSLAFSVNQIYNNYGYLYQISSGRSLIWKCISMNQYDQVTQADQGDGGSVTKQYSGLGYLQSITATEPSAGTVMYYGYGFNDQTGNLETRSGLYGDAEQFTYDNLDRLTQVINENEDVAGSSLTMSYGTGGVIVNKSDVGSYIYGATQPHAVSAIEYMPNPNNLPQDIQQASPTPNEPSLKYTPFKKISTIQEGPFLNLSSNEVDYVYGPDHQRKLSVESSLSVPNQTVVYSGAYENIATSTTNYQVDYIQSPDGLVAMNVNNTLYYVHTDHLGSIINVYNSALNFNYNQSFDAWGNYRDPASWAFVASSSVASTYNPPAWLIRGYTGHEQLPQFGLINMNGRVYDPLIAHILSPDPVMQYPMSSQGYNKYAYCLNNPLKYTDPSGYNIFDDILKSISKFFGGDPAHYTSNANFGGVGHSDENHASTNKAGKSNDQKSQQSNISEEDKKNFEQETQRTESQNSSQKATTQQQETKQSEKKTVASTQSTSQFTLQNNGFHLTYQRLWETGKSTSGTFSIWGTNIHGYILEPPGPSTTISGLNRRIPAGTYNLITNPASKYGLRLSNEQVPSSRAILMHSGSFPADTKGCLLPGSIIGTDFVGGSRNMVKELMDYFNTTGTTGATITILDIPNNYKL